MTLIDNGWSYYIIAALFLLSPIMRYGDVAHMHRLDPEEFIKLCEQGVTRVVVRTDGGLFSNKITYTTSHGGLAFYTSTYDHLHFDESITVIQAMKRK